MHMSSVSESQKYITYSRITESLQICDAITSYYELSLLSMHMQDTEFLKKNEILNRFAIACI